MEEGNDDNIDNRLKRNTRERREGDKHRKDKGKEERIDKI
jgi:hypothetical protein